MSTIYCIQSLKHFRRQQLIGCYYFNVFIYTCEFLDLPMQTNWDDAVRWSPFRVLVISHPHHKLSHFWKEENNLSVTANGERKQRCKALDIMDACINEKILTLHLWYFDRTMSCIKTTKIRISCACISWLWLAAKRFSFHRYSVHVVHRVFILDFRPSSPFPKRRQIQQPFTFFTRVHCSYMYMYIAQAIFALENLSFSYNNDILVYYQFTSHTASSIDSSVR